MCVCVCVCHNDTYILCTSYVEVQCYNGIMYVIYNNYMQETISNINAYTPTYVAVYLRICDTIAS